jgi:hypothetical protein
VSCSLQDAQFILPKPAANKQQQRHTSTCSALHNSVLHPLHFIKGETPQFFGAPQKATSTGGIVFSFATIIQVQSTRALHTKNGFFGGFCVKEKTNTHKERNKE